MTVPPLPHGVSTRRTKAAPDWIHNYNKDVLFTTFRCCKRDNLELAAGTAQFRDKLPGGAYSEISGPGLGDESVWTDVNGTLTVRKGNITVQVLMPPGKQEQIKVAQAFLAKF